MKNSGILIVVLIVFSCFFKAGAASEFVSTKPRTSVANWGNGKVYFFRGNEYIRWDIKADRADPGYPKIIDDTTWPGLWK